MKSRTSSFAGIRKRHTMTSKTTIPNPRINGYSTGAPPSYQATTRAYTSERVHVAVREQPVDGTFRVEQRSDESETVPRRKCRPSFRLSVCRTCPEGRRSYDRAIAEIQQDVHALNVKGETTKRLQAEAGEVMLEIVRRYFDAAGDVFEVSVSVHPATRFSVSMRLTR
ncbi:UTRA domain-containing protein [Paraburkholderia sp. RL18-101-BIB-B]|uniref:UTRA domain-containing protein n=1 Tax=Paraburkholderia sp. RL18-101-BIB-B TaxID=3031634 RepID=UPI0038BAE87C